MKKIIFLLMTFCGAGLFANAQGPDAPSTTSTGEVIKTVAITYTVINSANHTWGYDIYSNNKLTIHQPSRPGMPGNEGFKTKESASKVAELMVSKMKKGEMPPTVTKEEMEKMNVL